METKDVQSDNTLNQVLFQLQELKGQISDIHSEIRLHAISALRIPRHHDERTTVSSGTCSSEGSYRSILSDLLPSLYIDVHKEVLKEEHRKLMDIDLRTTNILDYLVENKVLQSSEAEVIRNTKSSSGEDDRSSQSRALLFKLQNRDEHCFKHFIDSLEEAYPLLAKRVRDAYNVRLHEGCIDDDDSNMKCVVCRIKNNVKVYEIIDTFYQEKLIDATVAECILNCENSTKQWTNLCEVLKANPSLYDCMVEALREGHLNLSEELEKVYWRSFTCYCRHLKAKYRQKQKDYNQCDGERNCDPSQESTSSGKLGKCCGTLKQSQGSDYVTVVEVNNNDCVKDRSGAKAGKPLRDANRQEKRRKAFMENSKKEYDNVTLNK
ncbi:uncharacterized protein LOC133189590 [Saccostrea echinata]|uniref:uncharacterized protein LOC133189590 n=1 Tax=Saccostrea echinata TaxID=191078 RepID=UPI002A8368A4|nr:uncharacterized protein LOC133189590 [Saccostrea echinata]